MDNISKSSSICIASISRWRNGYCFRTNNHNNNNSSSNINSTNNKFSSNINSTNNTFSSNINSTNNKLSSNINSTNNKLSSNISLLSHISITSSRGRAQIRLNFLTLVVLVLVHQASTTKGNAHEEYQCPHSVQEQTLQATEDGNATTSTGPLALVNPPSSLSSPLNSTNSSRTSNSSVATASKHHPVSELLGNKPAKMGAYPWQGRLLYNGKFRCGLTILNEHWVMTAAHCVMSVNLRELRKGSRPKDAVKMLHTENMMVAIGDVERRLIEGPEKYLYVSKIELHPSYLESKENVLFLYNMALLQVRSHWKQHKPFKFFRNARPACVPPEKMGMPDSLDKCIVSGWGSPETKPRKTGKTKTLMKHSSSETLKAEHVEVLIREKCLKEMSSKPIYLSSLCVKTHERTGVCRVDNGGPLVCYARNGSGNSEIPFLVGVASGGLESGFCHSGIPQMFLHVKNHTDWILSTIAQSSSASFVLSMCWFRTLALILTLVFLF